MDEFKTPIVIDTGTSLTKVGFAGEDEPREVFPTCATIDGYPSFIGWDAYENRNKHKIKHPVKNGLINDWDIMRKIWKFAFVDVLKINPKEHPILFVIPPYGHQKIIPMIIKIMFEEFQIPALSFELSSVLNLYASGRTKGLSVEIGEGVSTITSVVEGFINIDTTRITFLSGLSVLNNLNNYLKNQTGYFIDNFDNATLKDIIERHCYLALDPEKEKKIFEKFKLKNNREYDLPNGEKIVLGTERFLTPEIFFDPPNLPNKKFVPLDELIYDTVVQEDKSLREFLFKNIILAGGWSRIPGLKERLLKELTEMVPENILIRIVSPPHAHKTAWIGGSILASLKSYRRLWIEYEPKINLSIIRLPYLAEDISVELNLQDKKLKSRKIRYKIFVSYAREDKEKAVQIYNHLASFPHYDPWLDDRSLKGGQDFNYVITEQILNESDFAIMVLSPKSLEKEGYVQKEMKMILDRYQQMPPGRVYAIPCRLEKCKPKHQALKALNWVNMVPDFQKGLKDLVEAIESQIAKLKKK